MSRAQILRGRARNMRPGVGISKDGAAAQSLLLTPRMHLVDADNGSASMPDPRGMSGEFAAGMVNALPDLQRCARYLAANATEAKDLVQETCRRALEARERFVPRTRMSAWLNCILRNLHRDRIRRATFEVLVADATPFCPSSAATDDPPAWTLVSDADLSRAFAALPRMYGEIYSMRVVDGLSYQAMARRLGIGTRTVATRLRRARLRLRLLVVRDPTGEPRR